MTKHDKDISGRQNGRRIMEDLDPGIHTGDGGGMDMKLSNQVYNKIKRFSQKDSKRTRRVKDKADQSTVAQAVDPQTRILLFKMVNNGVLDSINGIVSTGKEAVILNADGGEGESYFLYHVRDRVNLEYLFSRSGR